jgi:hypothetical protein
MSILTLRNAPEWPLLKTRLDLRLCMKANTPSVKAGAKFLSESS